MSPTGEIPDHRPYGQTRRTGGRGRTTGQRKAPAPTKRTRPAPEPSAPTTPRQRRIRLVAILLIAAMLLVVIASFIAGVNN